MTLHWISPLCSKAFQFYTSKMCHTYTNTANMYVPQLEPDIYGSKSLSKLAEITNYSNNKNKS